MVGIYLCVSLYVGDPETEMCLFLETPPTGNLTSCVDVPTTLTIPKTKAASAADPLEKTFGFATGLSKFGFAVRALLRVRSKRCAYRCRDLCQGGVRCGRRHHIVLTATTAAGRQSSSVSPLLFAGEHQSFNVKAFYQRNAHTLQVYVRVMH